MSVEEEILGSSVRAEEAGLLMVMGKCMLKEYLKRRDKR